MNILIFGASGATGHELVKQALDLGHQVTAFVRNPSRLKINNQKLTMYEGDVINYKLVEEAVKNQDAVISALGASSPFKYDQSVVDGIENIVNAMGKINIIRFIYLSAFNVKESRKQAGLLIRCIAPILLRTETAGHEAREKIIRSSHLKWTLVRSAGLTNGNHTSKYRSGENISANGFMGSISRADLADFMLKEITDSQFIGKAPLVMY